LKILILGSGPCGLGAAYHLHRLGYSNWQIFERDDHVGGLSASLVDEKGFTWDMGGHVLFSHYPYFDQAVTESLGDAYYEHQRESWIRLLQTWVPYPFQNNVRYLPDDALQECLDGLRRLKGSQSKAPNFREWMDAVFGHGIVRYFMAPYNWKVWGTPLEMMSRDWIAERVSMIDLARIVENIAEKRDDLSWGPNNTFKFPRQGGTGAIYEGIAANFQDKIHINHRMETVDLARKQVLFSNGHIEVYDLLINTTPLDLLVRACNSVPDTVHQASDDLVHNSGLVVGAGFQGRRDDTKCWMYFPEDVSPFYRVTNFHNYSPRNVPGGDTGSFYSLMCETTYSSWKPVDKMAIVAETLNGLEGSGLLAPGERERLATACTIDIPYSYPVPTLGRDAALAMIQPYLESHGIYSRGRFGAWKYEVGNMDHSFMQGVELVDRLLFGKEEQTIHGKIG